MERGDPHPPAVLSDATTVPDGEVQRPTLRYPYQHRSWSDAVIHAGLFIALMLNPIPIGFDLFKSLVFRIVEKNRPR
ncbi:hypothetical protein BBL07_07095 [Agrobacterium vitis]|nr:hypothetical protein BBL07_07095 [Agrobacterium vitis]